MDALINLSGNVGTDVEYIEGDGWSYARFRLACTPRFLRKGEWTDGETTWITVRCTNRTAANVHASVRKGDPVVVVGKLRTHTWLSEKGERMDRLVVEATNLGHDLTRGATTFTRNERSEPERQLNEEDGEPIGVTESAGEPGELEPVGR